MQPRFEQGTKLTLLQRRVLETIVTASRHKAREEWRKLFMEELHDWQSSGNMIRVIKPRGMR